MTSVQASSVFRDENATHAAQPLAGKSGPSQKVRKPLGSIKNLQEQAPQKAAGKTVPDSSKGAVAPARKVRRPLANITNSAGITAAKASSEAGKSQAAAAKPQTKPKFLERPVVNQFLDTSDEVGHLAGKCGYDLEQEEAAAEEERLKARVKALVESFGCLDQGDIESECSRDLDPCPREMAPPDFGALEAFASAELDEAMPSLDVYFSCFSDTQSDDM